MSKGKSKVNRNLELEGRESTLSVFLRVSMTGGKTVDLQEIYRPAMRQMEEEPGVVRDASWVEEQISRCLHGYKPPEKYPPITGPHYFYLNFCKIATGAINWAEKLYDHDDAFTGTKKERERQRRQLESVIDRYRAFRAKHVDNPLFRDVDWRLFTAIEDARLKGKGLIVLKARDKGFSWMMAAYLVWGFLFFPENEQGVGAARDNYVQDIRRKILFILRNLPECFQVKLLSNNKAELTAGSRQKAPTTGSWMPLAPQSSILFRTVNDPDVFRGTRLFTLLLDEAGEINELLRTFMVSEACLKEGAVRFGVPIIGGTANRFSRGFEDFRHLWYNAEKYDLVRHFISAAEGLAGFFEPKSGKSFTERAEKYIRARAESLKEVDRQAYYLYLQEYPLKPEDALTDASGHIFPIDRLREQLAALMDKEPVSRGRLEWVGGRFSGKVRFVADARGWLQVYLHPRPDWRGLDIIGVDPYLHAGSKEAHFRGASYGAAVVYRRFYSVEELCELPIALYYERPDSKQIFYERLYMICCYYGAKALIENTDPEFVDYFRRMDALHMLARRPLALESARSVSKYTYGINMTAAHKTMLVEKLATWLTAHAEKLVFKDLIDDLLAWGARSNDLSMAFGIALLYDYSLTLKRPIHQSEKDSEAADAEGKLTLPGFRQQGDTLVVDTPTRPHGIPVVHEGRTKVMRGILSVRLPS